MGSNLNRRRYAQNDETLYVVPEDQRTDYVSARATLVMRAHSHVGLQSQPPMANWYSGVLKYVDHYSKLDITLMMFVPQYWKTKIRPSCTERRSPSTMAALEEGANANEQRFGHCKRQGEVGR